MSICRCAEPHQLADPRTKGICRRCRGGIMQPEWDTTDRNFGLFFERLAEAMFPAYASTLDRRNIPGWFMEYYRQCSHREKAGREKFGIAYLGYQNFEYMEEMADGANYAYMKLLKDRRDGQGEKEIDRRLSMARHAALGWKDAYEEQRQISHSFSEGDSTTE